MLTRHLFWGTGQTGTAIPHCLFAYDRNVEIYGTDINESHRDPFYTRLREMGLDTRNVHFFSRTESGHLYEPALAPDALWLTVPGSQQESAIRAALPYIGPHTILIDVCSAKESSLTRIHRAMEQFGLRNAFLPFHPLNGFAGDGPASAKPDILRAPCVYIPTEGHAIEKTCLVDYLSHVGAQMHAFDAPKHDEVLSTSSQHRYVVAFALAQTPCVQFAEAGMADPGHGNKAMHRILSASPEMWACNFTDCQKWIVDTASPFQDAANGLLQKLVDGDHKAIERDIWQAHDFAKLLPSKNVQSYDLKEFDGKDLSLTALNGVISLAFTQNLVRVQDKTGIDIPSICNPSAKDIAAPMGQTPAQSIELVKRYGDVLPNLFGTFISSHSHVMRMASDLKQNPKREGSRIVDPAYERVRQLVRDCGKVHERLTNTVFGPK